MFRALGVINRKTGFSRENIQLQMKQIYNLKTKIYFLGSDTISVSVAETL